MKIEIRDNGVVLDGYVNAVARDSRLLPSPRGRFVEQIVPKTFERALSRGKNVELRFNHLENRRLGSLSDGNLELYEDNIGLRAKCNVNDAEIVSKARNGELRGWSFGFVTLADRWEDNNGIQRRFVDDLDLLEVSILDMTPAYIGTSIEERDEETLLKEHRHEDATITVEDFSKQEEEKREAERESIDYSLIEREIELYKLKTRGC